MGETNQQRELSEARSTISKLQQELVHTNQGMMALTIELEQRSSEIEAINKELEAFTYSVSHDLRAPLRSITGFSEALMVDYSDSLDEQAHDFLTRIYEASKRMNSLIESLLRLCHITKGEINRTTIDLSAMADKVIQILRQQEPQREVNANIALNVTAKGDRVLLFQVMENLLSNAWKFTDEKSKATIEVGQVEMENETIYFVRDDGYGFDIAKVNRIFMPFQRLHPELNRSGDGIGLATVQRIVHRHGGKIWVESIVGKGSTFFFTLN